MNPFQEIAECRRELAGLTVWCLIGHGLVLRLRWPPSPASTTGQGTQDSLHKTVTTLAGSKCPASGRDRNRAGHAPVTQPRRTASTSGPVGAIECEVAGFLSPACQAGSIR